MSPPMLLLLSLLLHLPQSQPTPLHLLKPLLTMLHPVKNYKLLSPLNLPQLVPVTPQLGKLALALPQNRPLLGLQGKHHSPLVKGMVN